MKSALIATALSSGEFAEKLARSSQYVVQSTIGASSSRRISAFELARKKLQSPEPDRRIAYGAMALALELGLDDFPIPNWEGDSWLKSGAECPWIVEVDRLTSAQLAVLTPHWFKILETTQNSHVIEWSIKGLCHQCENEPDRAALAIRIGESLIVVLSKTKIVDGRAIQAAGRGLCALSKSLDQPTAIRAFDGLLAGLHKTTNIDSERALCDGLIALSLQLNSVEIIRCFRELLLNFPHKKRDRNSQEAIDKVLSRLAPRLSQTDAEIAFNQLVFNHGEESVGALRALADRVDQQSISRATSSLLFDHRFGYSESVRLSLSALARNMDQSTATRAGARLISVIGEPNSRRSEWPSAINCLVILAHMLDQPTANRASERLVVVLGITTDGRTLRAASDCLAKLADRLDSPTAVRAFDALTTLIETTTDTAAKQAAGQALVVMTSRMDQSAAIDSFNTLVVLLRTATDPDVQQRAGRGLSALATKFDQPTANQACEGLMVELRNKPNQHLVLSIADAIVVLTERLDFVNANRAHNALKPFANARYGDATLKSVIRALGALATQLDPTTNRDTFALMTNVLLNHHDDDVGMTVAIVLSGLAKGIDQEMARDMCQSWIEALNKSTDQKDQYLLRSFGRVFPAMSQRLNTVTLERLADITIQKAALINDGRLLNVVLAAIAEILVMLPAERRQTYSENCGVAIVRALQRTRDADDAKSSWDALDFLMDEFSPRQIGCIPPGSLAIGSDIGDINPLGLTLTYSVFFTLKETTQTAQCLRHPACVGEIRQQVLHRLEELAFPPTPSDQQQALVPSLVSGLTEPLAAGVLAAARQAKWERERKFRTIWDAVDWLKKNHPEIDLDAPYRPRR